MPEQVGKDSRGGAEESSSPRSPRLRVPDQPERTLALSGPLYETLRVVTGGGRSGLAVAFVARALAIRRQAAYLRLKKLRGRGLVEMSGEKGMARWRRVLRDDGVDRQALVARHVAAHGVTRCPGFGDGPLPHYDDFEDEHRSDLQHARNAKRARVNAASRFSIRCIAERRAVEAEIVALLGSRSGNRLTSADITRLVDRQLHTVRQALMRLRKRGEVDFESGKRSPRWYRQEKPQRAQRTPREKREKNNQSSVSSVVSK